MADKPSAAIILGLKPKGGDYADDEPDTDGYEKHSGAAEDFADAVKSGNLRDLKDAFKAMFESCLNEAETKGMIKNIAKEADAEPHEEGPHEGEA